MSNNFCHCSKPVQLCDNQDLCQRCGKCIHDKWKSQPLNQRNVSTLIGNCMNCYVENCSCPKIESNKHDVNVIMSKYDKMSFNPVRYEDTLHNIDEEIHDTNMKCSYILPNQFTNSVNSGDLSILNVNIRSINKNFDKLKECLEILDHEFTIIGLSETHMKEKPLECFHLPGYNIEYTNRKNREKGGVCMYITDKVKYKLRADLSMANSNYESCFIEIENNKHKNIIVGVIYRAHTPIDNFVGDFNPILNKINQENKINFIMGDFNIDLLKDDTDRATHDYLDLIYSHSLIPSIHKPTRITEETATIIDNILTNYDRDVNSRIVLTDISDHLPTIVTTNCAVPNKSNNNKYVHKRLLTDGNVSKLKQKLSNIEWDNVLQGDNVNDDYEMFLKTFTETYNDCIPIKKCVFNKKKDPKSPWITRGLLKSINTKNKLYKEFINNPTQQRTHKFKTYRNKLHGLIRKSKRDYMHKRFEQIKGNMKKTWNMINTIIGRNKKDNNQTVFKKGTDLVSNPTDIANEFNKFFVDIGPKLAKEIKNSGKDYFEYMPSPLCQNMFMKPIVEMEIIKIISKFNKNKSPGHDDIGNNVLKKISKEIATPLTRIFNLSISSGEVPDSLKIAKVIPIYKKDDPQEFSNYRPVSVLPSFSKIMERLVFNRCVDFIDKHNILNANQYGFRTGHSTYMAIVDFVDRICNAVENNQQSISLFLDLSKAFDTIDHDILLHKLTYYGFRGKALDWFNSYLSNRKQYVIHNNEKSTLEKLTCGVPQGSILGPLLFILYVNDIVNTSSVLKFVLFADDTTILYSHEDLVSNINVVNNELKEVTNWFKANRLSVNAKKTNYMLLGARQRNSRDDDKIMIKLDDTSLERVLTTKFLGVTIDENLTWKNHIDGVTKTISRNIGVINKLKYTVPERVLHTLYCTLVLPYINYNILVWGNTCYSYMDKLLKLQKWAVRSITKSHYRSHSAPLFKKLKILNVYDSYKLEVGVFMFRYSLNQLPERFNIFFARNNDFHDYHTRNGNDFTLTRNKKVFSDQSIKTTGPILWKSIRQNIKDSRSIKHFRNQLKSHYLSNY